MIGLLIWIAVGSVLTVIHNIFFGPTDLSSYMVGMFVAITAIAIEDYYK